MASAAAEESHYHGIPECACLYEGGGGEDPAHMPRRGAEESTALTIRVGGRVEEEADDGESAEAGANDRRVDCF